MKCDYRGCNDERVRDSEFCVFHAAPNLKATSLQEFNNAIYRLMSGGHYCFDGFVFPGPITFGVLNFKERASFKNADFHGRVRFQGKQIGHPVDFEGAEFRCGVDFTGVEFWGEANFRDVVFRMSSPTADPSASAAEFKGTTFSNNADFTSAAFLDGNVSFDGARFIGARTDFSYTEFNGQANSPADVIFRGGDFGGEYLGFRKATFSNCQVEFIGRTFNSQKVDFGGATFEKSESFFNDSEFLGKDGVIFRDAIFDRAVFEGVKVPSTYVVFAGAKFLKGDAVFDGFTVSSGRALFNGAKFKGGTASFNSAHFTGSRCDFSDAEFSCHETSFQRAELGGDLVSFNYAVFACSLTDFAECNFDSRSTCFIGSAFLGTVVSFVRATFAGRVILTRNSIAGSISFNNVDLGETSSFRFASPSFFNIDSRQHPIRVFFKRVTFNPHLTFFQGFIPGEYFVDSLPSVMPAIVFRYCNLREAYFLKNNMSMFSFHQSAFFEESFFTSSKWDESRSSVCWPFWFKRHHLIIEDIRVLEGGGTEAGKSEVELNNDAFRGCDFPTSFKEIAEIYLRLKTAADQAKDYHMASWFYFNEFEMKRKAIIEKIGTHSHGTWKALRLLISPTLWQYNLYRLFAGYGEKPSWSFIWFGVFSVLFTVIHLRNGIEIPVSDGDPVLVKYILSLSKKGLHTLLTSNFWHDAFNAFAFTIQRVIPTSYLPGFETGVSSPSGPLSFSISLMNSVVLILMVVFTAIGLKRHFRRF